MGVSEHRACRIVAIDRKMARYSSKCSADAELRDFTSETCSRSDVRAATTTPFA